MIIRIAENAGFCFGVQNAFKKIVEIAKENDCPVNTLGPLIHNPQTIELLREKYGVDFIENAENAQDGIVVIRTHGVSPEVFKILDSKEIIVENATCPYVIKTQNYASKLHEHGRFVVIIGDPMHPEVISILGYAGNDGIAIEQIEQVEELPMDRKLGIVIQSTFIPEKAEKIITRVREKYSNCVIYNTICTVTQNRQSEAMEIAEISDYVLVIGGRNSANTEKLRQIALLHGVNIVKKIETIKEIDFEELSNVNNLGILAGASTPSWMISRVVSEIKEHYPHCSIIKFKPKIKNFKES